MLIWSPKKRSDYLVNIRKHGKNYRDNADFQKSYDDFK